MRGRVTSWAATGAVAVLAVVAGSVSAATRSATVRSVGAVSSPAPERVGSTSSTLSLPPAVASTPSTTVQGEYASPSVVLPSGFVFDQVAVSSGHLVLAGEVASTASARSPTCAAASVDPQTLHMTIAMTASCDDPALYGQIVGTANGYVPLSNNATIRVARVDPLTGQVSVGPVVMTYGSYSDTRPVTAYGGGWLWIYDNSTTTGPTETLHASNPGVPELLQVSAISGEVVDTIPMPRLFRPIMAADDAGLWIGNSIEGSRSSTLFYVAPGSNQAQVVIPSTTAIVCWLLGSGDHIWAGVGSLRRGACQQQTIQRFDGDGLQPVFDVADQGYHPNVVVGDLSQGLWTMQWASSGAAPATSPQDIIRIDPNTGAESVVATLPPLPVPITEGMGLVQGQAAVLGSSLYLLEPPLEPGTGLRYAALVKVPIP